MKKFSISIAVVFILLIITNPSVKAFKDFLGKSSYSGLRREYNFFLFSLYNSNGNEYLGVVGNFFKTRSLEERIETDPFKEFGGHPIDTALRDTSELPSPPKKYDEFGIPIRRK